MYAMFREYNDYDTVAYIIKNVDLIETWDNIISKRYIYLMDEFKINTEKDLLNLKWLLNKEKFQEKKKKT